MRSIEEIIRDWKTEYGVLKTGRNSQYLAIEFKERKTMLLSLVQTMVDEGHTKEDITSFQSRNKVVDACTAPDSAPIPAKNVKLWKKMVTEDYEYAFGKFFHGAVSKYVDKKAKEEIKPDFIKNIPLEPSDRIKLDTSGYAETEVDTDFLKEIGADSAIFGDPK